MSRVPEVVRSTRSRDGGIVLDIQQGRMFDLNLVGITILELLRSGSSESEIIQRIAREFNACHDQVAPDVREFVEVLQENGLIEEHIPQRRSKS